MKESVHPAAPAAVTLTAILSLIACAHFNAFAEERHEPWNDFANRVATTSDPDSTAVLVLFDADLFEYLRSRLAPFKVVAFRHPDVPKADVFVPLQLGRMYREGSAATRESPDVWVVGMRSGSSGRRKAARFADQVAALFRRRVLRDSLDTPRGNMEFSRWTDQPGGAARRIEMARSQAWAESVMAVGVPKPIPITRPFSPSELRIDADTLSFYLAKMADTSFYSIGGCSEVETVTWDAVEKLASLGPGVVPPLIERIDDPDPFVKERAQEALSYATQDERILARTGGEYLRFYDKRDAPVKIVRDWWARYGGFWAAADTTNPKR